MIANLSFHQIKAVTIGTVRKNEVPHRYWTVEITLTGEDDRQHSILVYGDRVIEVTQ